MRERRHKLAKYLACAKSALQDKLSYGPDAAGQALSYAIFVFIFINLWKAVFSGKIEISGYTRESAIWYFIIAELAAFASAGSFGAISEDVKSGSIAYSLGRPYSYVLFQYARNFGEMLLPEAAMAVLGILMGTLAAGPLPLRGILHLPAVLVSLFLGASLSFFILTALSLTAFWIEENSVFFWIYQKLILIIGTLMPVEFLPAGLQPLARLSPFSSVAWAPARLAVAFSPREASSILIVQALWTALAACAAFFVFNRGVKHVSVQGG
jgi:ABC-2 type transport system permease protein